MCDGFDSEKQKVFVNGQIVEVQFRDPGVPADWVCKSKSALRCNAGDHAFYPPGYTLTPLEEATTGGDQ